MQRNNLGGGLEPSLLMGFVAAISSMVARCCAVLQFVLLLVLERLACNGEQLKADWLKIRPPEFLLPVEVGNAVALHCNKVAVDGCNKCTAATRQETIIACALCQVTGHNHTRLAGKCSQLAQQKRSCICTLLFSSSPSKNAALVSTMTRAIAPMAAASRATRSKGF